jgi:hypothetical protein
MSDALGVALAGAVGALRQRGRSFALVGGLAASIRGEIRFTRDVDLAVVVDDDNDAERLIFQLRSAGYDAVASVEHETRDRLSTVRLMSPQGVKIDLLFACCGIEAEVVAGATEVDVPGAGVIAVAATEELIAMKVLSMSDRRLQDRIDARQLLGSGAVDLERVRADLGLIAARGYDRDENLDDKLALLLAEIGG